MTGFRARVPWAVLLLVVAALEFASSYRGAVAPVAFVVVAAAPFALVRLGQLARAGTFAPALVTIVLCAGGAWAALHRSSGASLGGLGDAVPRLLTTARPAEASAALLAPALLLVALVATVVAACVLVPVEGRVAGLVAPVVGTAVVYVAAALLSAGAADPHGIVACCLLVVIVGGWSLPYLRGGLRVAWRPVAVLPLLAAVVVALGIATLTPASAYDPRHHVTPPTVRLTEASPLSQLGSWSANPSATILQTRLTGTRRLHLATLSEYTGASWQVDDDYRQLGLVGSGDLPAGQRRAAARATVRIVRMSGVWLPAPGTASSTSLTGAVLDPDDGTLARPEQVRPGLRYDVTASVPDPTGTALSVAAVPTRGAQRYLALPDAPAGFAQYARAAVRGASTPLEEAVALEHAVSTNRRLDPTAPTGSSYGRLQTFLFSPAGVTGAQAGTDEQFAASFAVLARAVGLPSRLVVGFLVPKAGADGTSTVHGRDATVWPEIYFSGIGWVPFAPTPGDGAGSADAGVRDNVLQRLSEQAAVLPVPPATPPAAATNPPAPPTADRTAAAARSSSGVPLGAWIGIGLGVLVVLLVGLVLLLRALRSSRHRRAGARGAWAEIVDLLVLTGRRPPPSRPAPEVAADADLGEPGLALARAADLAAFAPGASADVDLWSDVRLLRRRARRGLPRYRRLLLPVDPRPLLRR